MHVVNENTFLYSVMVSLKVPTKREIIQALKKNDLNYDPASIDPLMKQIREKKKKNDAVATTYMLNDPGIALIIFWKWNGNAFSYGVLVHELFHAVDMNLRTKGITLSDDSDETYAYHIGYFTREFLNRIWKQEI